MELWVPSGFHRRPKDFPHLDADKGVEFRCYNGTKNPTTNFCNTFSRVSSTFAPRMSIFDAIMRRMIANSTCLNIFRRCNVSTYLGGSLVIQGQRGTERLDHGVTCTRRRHRPTVFQSVALRVLMRTESSLSRHHHFLVVSKRRLVTKSACTRHFRQAVHRENAWAISPLNREVSRIVSDQRACSTVGIIHF